MASYLSNARDRIAEIAVSTLGLSGVNKIFDIATAEKVDWRGLMARIERDATAEGLTPPYCVIVFGPAMPTDLGLSNRARAMEVHVIYISDLRSGSTSLSMAEVRTNIEDKLVAYEAALLTDADGTIQTWDISTDLDSSNPANDYYQTFGVPLYAGILRAQIICGLATP